MAAPQFDPVRFAAGVMPTLTRDGRTLARVFNSGLPVQYPVAVWVVGANTPYWTRTNGMVNANDTPSPDDILHEPRILKFKLAVIQHPQRNEGKPKPEVIESDGELRSYQNGGFTIIKIVDQEIELPFP